MLFKNILYILVAAQSAISFAQEAEGASQSKQFTILSATGIPFFAAGRCATVINCGASLGSATVTTVTTTIPGINPVETWVTITPTGVRPGATHTVFVVPPFKNAGRQTVTVTVKPGDNINEHISTKPDPGAPATVWFFPGGDPPTSTVTVTSTLPFGHGGSNTLTLGGQLYLPGQDFTLTVIPPVTTDLTVTACPPQQTVTIIQQPAQAPAINFTKPDGSIESRPASKFPCSKDDKHPCRGTQVQGWTVFTCLFGGDRKMDGKTYPQPWKHTVDYAYDTIFTVSDSWYQAEHWTIRLDGQKIGETSEDGFQNNKLACSADGDSCIAKGFSHGSFSIPKGRHEIEVEWTDGPLTYAGGWKWTHGYGVFRFDKFCTCGEKSEL